MSDATPAPGTSGGRWNRAWRVFATGFSFACFGLGAVLMGFTLWPLLRLSSRRYGTARVQRAVSVSMRVFVWLMKTLGLLTYEVRGLAKLSSRGQFVVANHPTLIDVVFLVSLMPEVDVCCADATPRRARDGTEEILNSPSGSVTGWFLSSQRHAMPEVAPNAEPAEPCGVGQILHLGRLE